MAAPQPQPPAINELLQSARPSLQRVLWRFRIPPEDADDLLQDAAIHYLRKQQEIRDPQKWLTGALRNECLLYWRRHSRRLYDSVDQAILDLVADDGVEAQERQILRNRLREMIPTLDYRCRTVLTLRYRLGYDDGEIADQTGYQPSSVDKIARRCVAELGRKLLSLRILRRPNNG